MPTPSQAVVIGGGISGLACAFRLQELGVPVTLLEASDRIGGLLDSVEKNGFLFEKGPQSLLATDPVVALVRALGLEDDLLPSDPRAPRFVLVRGRLRAVPMTPPALLATSLLGVGSKLRLVSESLRRSRPPESDESVASFVRRKFGNEILEYLVAPFVSGVYAGDPEKLSMRSAFPTLDQWEREYGSVLRGAIKSRPPKSSIRPGLCSFRRGMGTLPRRLAEKLGACVQTNASVESVERRNPRDTAPFELRVSQRGREERRPAGAVIVATPAFTAGRLLGGISPSLAAALSGVAYAPVAVVANGYRREQIGLPPDGFGFLVPRKENLRTLGTVWNSSLFPGRAPEHMVTLTSFAGGATDPDLVQWEAGAIAAIVEGEVACVMKISGHPVERAAWRYTKALPQYNLGHAHTVEAIRRELALHPGLFLAGNYLEGPSIGNCVERGFRTAEAARDYLSAAR